MLNNFLHYFLYSSVVLVYGIGIDRAVELCEKPGHLLLRGVKILITVCSTVVLSYLLTTALFVPAGLMELYPFVVVLIYIGISVFIEALIRITARVRTSDFGLSLMYAFLALSESVSL